MDLETGMSMRPLALIPLALALVLFAAGCSDERHPTAVEPPGPSHDTHLQPSHDTHLQPLD